MPMKSLPLTIRIIRKTAVAAYAGLRYYASAAEGQDEKFSQLGNEV